MYQTTDAPALSGNAPAPRDPDALTIGTFQILPSPGPDAGAIARAFSEIALAERAGFDSVWFAEHHLASFGLIGAPSVFAAAVAGRTSLDIGYAVAVLPLHHPVRLAEEIAWLTHLAPGRVLVGVGPGFSPVELGAFGVPGAERHARFAEASAIVHGLLSEESLCHQGKYWTVPRSTLRPRPLGGAPRFLRATSSAESMAAIATAGETALLGLKATAEIAERLALYRAVRREAGIAREVVDREIGEFRVLRRVVVSDSTSAAVEAARRALRWEEETAHRALFGESAGIASPPPPSEAMPGGCIGDPEMVASELEDLHALGIRRVIAWTTFGDLPESASRRSIELLAGEVLPRVARETTAAVPERREKR